MWFDGEGDESPGQPPGDVLVEVKQQSHKTFERHGDDLHMDMKISLKEALLGFTKIVNHLDGHAVEVASQDVIQPFQVVMVPNEGMPKKDFPSEFGSLKVRFEIQFPKTLSEEAQEAVRAW